jgi:carboxylesterase
VSIMPGAEPFRFDAGEAAPAGVVLCHGFTGTPQSLRTWGEHLHRAGFSVHGPRLPGHGTRWQDLNATRWEDWYGELERAFDAMLDRYPVVLAMGLSMGGTLVLRLAQQRGSELAGAVVVNPSLLTLRRDSRLLPVASRLLSSVPGVANDIKKPDTTELAYDRTPLKAALSLSHLWRLTRAGLPRVTVPLRLYRSAEDHVVEAISSRVLLERISSTDVTETVLPNSYHVATLDYDAETIFSGSAQFTAKLAAAQLAPGGSEPGQ